METELTDLTTWGSLQLHLGVFQLKISFSALLRTHFLRVEGPRDPSPLPPCSLKISGDCLYSADFPLVPFQRELRWKSVHSQTAPFQVPLGLALTWKAPGEGTAPPPLWSLPATDTVSLLPPLQTQLQPWRGDPGLGTGHGGMEGILFLLSPWGLPRRELKFCPGNKTWRERDVSPSPSLLVSPADHS